MVVHRAGIPLVFALVVSTAAAQQGSRVTETEPNDNAASANLVHLRDTVSGTISNSRTDVDFFQLDLRAGDKLEFELLDRKFCHVVVVYRADRTTRVTGGDCRDELRVPSGLFHFVAPATERYYVSLRQYDDRPGDADPLPPTPYDFRLGVYTAPAPGLGDPVSIYASGLTSDNASIDAMTASPDGDLFVLDNGASDRILRISPDGAVRTFASDARPTFNSLAVDAFGDLLVSSYNDNAVWRYSIATGARTLFTTRPQGPFAYVGIAIGPDGDVWLGEPGDNTAAGAAISRFDALGTIKDRIPIDVGRVWGLAFSPSGDLHFVTQGGSIYKLSGRTPQLVIAAPTEYASPFANIAFDGDGWLYASFPSVGRVVLFNPQYQKMRDPLAQVLDSLGWDHMRLSGPVVFLRDRSGATTSRLVVGRNGHGFDETGPYRDEIVELNHAGMGAAGADVALRMDRSPLREGSASMSYADTLRLLGGRTASEWRVIDGQLPAGITLGSGSGVLSGTPRDTGTYAFAVRASDGSAAAFGRFSITIGVAPPVQVTITDIANALLGGTPLSADAVRYLDSHGNNNGKLDVGDLRAFLRAQGQLTGSQ